MGVGVKATWETGRFKFALHSERFFLLLGSLVVDLVLQLVPLLLSLSLDSLRRCQLLHTDEERGERERERERGELNESDQGQMRARRRSERRPTSLNRKKQKKNKKENLHYFRFIFYPSRKDVLF